MILKHLDRVVELSSVLARVYHIDRIASVEKKGGWNVRGAVSLDDSKVAVT